MKNIHFGSVLVLFHTKYAQIAIRGRRFNCMVWSRKPNGLKPKLDGLKPKLDGLMPKSDGLKPVLDGLKPNSDGSKPKSGGLLSG